MTDPSIITHADTIHDDPLVVSIPGLGDVLGVREGEALAYHGLPFARPVSGDLRFAPPEPALPWTGRLDATCRRAIAPQPAPPSDVIMGAIPGPQDEDCLTLTIWKPANAHGLLPVIAWLHGGGFTTGGGDLPWYDGGLLAAEQDVVVVGINYRLGPLGFFHVDEVTPGNLAIRDQQLALQWIRDHIAAFGGDPDQVTAMGQSGGGHNIVMLLAARPERPLFRRAILQSAPLGIGLASREEARMRAALYLRELQLEAETVDLVDRLRSLPADTLLEALIRVGYRLPARAPGDLRPFFLPVEDEFGAGDSAGLISRAAETAAANGIALLMGWNRDEATFFLAGSELVTSMTEQQLLDAAWQSWGEAGVRLVKAPALSAPDAPPGDRFIAAVSDAVFRRPVLELADALQKAGGSAYLYQFDWTSPDPELGACHCIELPFVFGSFAAFDEGRMIMGVSLDAVAALARQVRRRWGDFAKGRTPGFPAWTAQCRMICHIDSESHVESHVDHEEEQHSPKHAVTSA